MIFDKWVTDWYFGKFDENTRKLFDVFGCYLENFWTKPINICIIMYRN